jgi:acyl-CoA synthetase (NDP forming)
MKNPDHNDDTGKAPAFPDLDAFFNPTSFALVGATEDLAKFGGRALKITMDFGFSGRLYPVNPRGGTIRGMQAYASVRDLPEAPDHVGVVVAADRVLGVLEDCAARGAKFVTVLTSGFAETGTAEGREMQLAIGEFARRTGVRVMGPNCNGLINFVDRMVFASTATLAGPPRPTGYVSVAAQSGGLGMVSAMWRAQEAGLGVNHVVTCGNDADLDILDFANFMVEDEQTRVVMMIAERIPDGAKLFRLARKAADAVKPLLIVKLGRTEEGRRAAASHTGAVTGSYDVHEAAFRQSGVIRVDDCQEMVELAMILGTGRLAGGRRASSLSISGGNVVMLTDLGAMVGIEWPEYSAQTHGKLAKFMPSYGRVANPADLTTAAIGTADVFQRVLATIAEDVNVDVLIPIVTFGPYSEIDFTAQLAARSTKPLALLWTGACTDRPELSARDLVQRGVPVYRELSTCVRAVGRAMDYGAFIGRHREGRAPSRPQDADVERARTLLRAGGATLGERESKAVLAAYGFRVTREQLAKTAQEAVAAAAAMGGPVALKIASADIPHKTEAGGVRLGLQGAEAVSQAHADILAAVRRYKPDARIDGVLVQEMAPPGVEMMLGVSRDAVFGPVVVAGLGGIHVEVLRDLAHRIPPVTREEAGRMLCDLRGRRILDGVRGMAPRDVDALAGAIERLSWFAADFRDELVELDVNPLVVLGQGQGCVIVDALIVRE